MIIETLFTPFLDFAFMRRALLGCGFLAFSAAPLGVLLILRRMSLMGDAIAHAVLPGIALGFFFAGLSLPLMGVGGLLAGLLLAAMVGLASRYSKLKEDANLAAFYLIALAAGVVLISMKGTALDLLHLLFGSLLAVDEATLLYMAAISSTSLLLVTFFLRPLMTEAFDPIFMQIVRGQGGWFHLGFLMLVVLNLLAGFQAVGTLMAVGLLILPAAVARFWAQRYLTLVVLAASVGVGASYAGLLLSYHFDLPSGPTVILIAGASYVFSLLFGRYGSIRARWFTKKHYVA